MGNNGKGMTREEAITALEEEKEKGIRQILGLVQDGDIGDARETMAKNILRGLDQLSGIETELLEDEELYENCTSVLKKAGELKTEDDVFLECWDITATITDLISDYRDAAHPHMDMIRKLAPPGYLKGDCEDGIED